MLFWTWMEHAQWWKLQLFFGNWRCTIESILVKNSQFVVKNDFWLNLKSFQWKCFEFSSVLHQFILHKSPLETCLPHKKKRCIPSIHVNESSCAHHFTVKFSPSICYQYAVFFYILASKFRYKHSMVMPWSMCSFGVRACVLVFVTSSVYSLSLSLYRSEKLTHTRNTDKSNSQVTMDRYSHFEISWSYGFHAIRTRPLSVLPQFAQCVKTQREKKCETFFFRSLFCEREKDREKNGT